MNNDRRHRCHRPPEKKGRDITLSKSRIFQTRTGVGGDDRRPKSESARGARPARRLHASHWHVPHEPTYRPSTPDECPDCAGLRLESCVHRLRTRTRRRTSRHSRRHHAGARTSFADGCLLVSIAVATCLCTRAYGPSTRHSSVCHVVVMLLFGRCVRLE